MVRILVLLCAAALGLAGLAGLTFSFLPFPEARALVDGLTSDGRAEAFTQEFFDTRAVPLARLMGAALLVTGVALWLWRRALATGLAMTSETMAAEVSGLARYANSHWRGLDTLQRVSLAIVFATGIALRLLYLHQPIRYDEAASYLEFASSRPLYLFYNYTPNNHILHTICMKLATLLLGGDPWVIRLPAFLSGCLALPVLYLLCARGEGFGAGLLAAALAAVNAHLILYSTNGRGYTLAFLLFCGVLAACIEVGHRRRGSGRSFGLWAWIAVLSALMLWTVPAMLYALLSALLVAVLLGGVRRLDLWRDASLTGIVAAVLAACLFVPIILLSGWRALLANPWVTQTVKNVDIAQGSLGLLVQLYGLWTEGWPLSLIVLAGLGLLAAPASRSRILLVAVTVLATGILLAKLQGVTPPGRVYLYALPLVLAAAGTGLARQLRGNHYFLSALAFATLAVGALGVYQSGVVLASPETGANPEAETVARFVQPQLRTGDRVLCTLPVAYPLFYWLRKLGASGSYRHLESMPRPDRHIIVVDRDPPKLPPGSPLDELVRQAVRDNAPVAIPLQDYNIGAPVYTGSKTMVLIAVRNGGH